MKEVELKETGLIDANSLIKKIKYVEEITSAVLGKAMAKEFCEPIIEQIEIEPTVTLDRKLKAHWKPALYTNFKGYEIKTNRVYMCSNCQKSALVKHNYCSWCGADMREENKPK